MFVPRYTEAELREVVARSRTMTEVLRHFGLRPAGGNHKLLRRWLETVGYLVRPLRRHTAARCGGSRSPLEAVLVPGSTYQRGQLKQRLYDAGLKQRACELCGQGEEWRGRRMSLILDHINGVADDNRLENLQIVCPNCAATLDTHCGRANRRTVDDQTCLRCGARFRPKSSHQRYCSRECGVRWARAGQSRPGARRVERPPYEELRAEVAALGWRAVGRKYGVSDNAVRKWMRAYEGARAGPGEVARLRVLSGRRRLVRRPPRLAIFMRFRTLAAAVAALLVPAAPAFAGDPTMPLSQVQAGMRCTGYSVIQGTTISSFDVQVLDVAGGEASGVGNILIQVSGPAVDATGIGPGFSGSPIYCPDAAGVSRNIGAISQSVNEYGGKVALATLDRGHPGHAGRRAGAGRRRPGRRKAKVSARMKRGDGRRQAAASRRSRSAG